MITCPKCKGTFKEFIIYIDENGDSGCGGAIQDCPVCSGTGHVTLLRWILAKIGVKK